MERFVEHSPMAVMARLVMQWAIHAEPISDALEQEEHEDTREQLFSMTVGAMASIEARLRRPSRASANMPGQFGALVAALHDSVSRLRAAWGRTLVRDSVELLLPALRPRADERVSHAAGFRLRVLDGGPMLRGMQCAGGDGCAHAAQGAGIGSYPAQTSGVLPVYDPELAMIVDLLPYERSYARDRAFLRVLMESVQPGELWLVDERFDANAIVSGWPRNGAAFIVAEHGCTPAYRELAESREQGRLGSDAVYEQAVGVADEWGASLAFRRIEWHRSAAGSGEDGDTIMSILTNVPSSQLDALEVVRLYRRRWSEALPLPLDAVSDEGVLATVPPRAALLASSIVALAYNVLSAMMTVVGSTLEIDTRDMEHLAVDIAAGVEAAYGGMMIALPAENWRRYDRLPESGLCRILRHLAVHLDPRSERRKRRDDRASARSQARLRAATLASLLPEEGALYSAAPFKPHTIAMATRDFSSNPSKALRHASEALVMVTKYNRPIALLVSIDDWNRLLGEVRETSLDRLSLDYAAFEQIQDGPVAGERSLN